MKNAIVLDQNDIKEILAEKYGVSTDCIIKSQYVKAAITAFGAKQSEKVYHHYIIEQRSNV